MNREAAEILIKATFEQPFDEDRYRYFVRELLNHLDESKAHTQAGAYIADAFKKHIRSFKRVGTYTDPAGQAIDILIVYLQKETALDRARTMQRNFVAHHLKNRSKEAALVAYTSPDLGDWRFSFVRLEYQLQTDEATGKVKLDESLTPSRRYSFLVGANEPNHTAQQQLIRILAEDAHNPGLETLEKAFDIEVVTQQFFEDYKERYLELVEAIQQLSASQPQAAAIFSEDSLTTANFAKRLMGQIVFLYFLQKKGWLGVREGQPGPKDFLRQLYEGQWRPYQNFFNEILEPLFYEALAVEHPDNYFERLDCQIPFLNGGLFEPPPGYDWRAAPLPLPNAVFGKIFETFDLYNFTVREDEPLEKEVAVDPEMLGKVFERLLEVQDRKSKGAFYTPREIVHYMCQESLINYLDTALNLRPDPLAKIDPEQSDMFAAPQPKQAALTALKYDPIVPKDDLEFLIRMGEFAQEYEQAKQAGTKSYDDYISAKVRLHAAKIDQALADVKICDPAIGSGAFPVGMMKEIVRTREVLTTYLPPSPREWGEPEGGLGGGASSLPEGEGSGVRASYAFKRHAIQHSLYGVDIDPGAVEIAKLRLWLSLVVDEDDFTQVKPLPNLDYKIVCGNSLIELVSPEFLAGTADPQRNALVAQLKQAKDDLFNLTHPGQKEQKRVEIETLIHQLFENYKAAEIRKLEEKIHGLRGQPGLFAGAKISKADQKKLQTWEAEIRRLQAMQLPGPGEHFEWHISFSEVFQDNGGFDVVIGNPPYIQLQKDGGALADLYQKTGYQTFSRMGDIYTLFYEKGFQVSRKGGHLSFITSNKWMRAGYGKGLRAFLLKNISVKRLIDFGDAPLFENATTYTNILIGAKEKGKASPSVNDLSAKADLMENLTRYLYSSSQDAQAVFSEKNYLIVNQAENRIKQKVEKAGIPLKDWDIEIYRGIVTGYNDAFIIDGKTRAKLIAADPKATDIIKPVLRGKDIKRYSINRRDEWVIATFPALNLNIDKYLSVKKHLESFGKRLAQTGETFIDADGKKQKSRKKTGNEWFETQDQISYHQEFEKEKIIWAEIVYDSAFYYDDESFFMEATGFIMTGEKLKVLTALLNSGLLTYAFHNFFSGGDLQNQFFRYKKAFLEQLPLVRPAADIEKKLESLVMDIQGMKKTNPTADTSALEAEIDRLVYQLYGLTPEEIAIVEAK